MTTSDPFLLQWHCTVLITRGEKDLFFFSHLRAKRSIKNAYPLSIISIIESWLNVQKGFSKCNIQNAIMVISLLLIYNDKCFLEYPIRGKKNQQQNLHKSCAFSCWELNWLRMSDFVCHSNLAQLEVPISWAGRGLAARRSPHDLSAVRPWVSAVCLWEASSLLGITCVCACGCVHTAPVHVPGNTHTAPVHVPGNTHTAPLHVPGNTHTVPVYVPGNTHTAPVHTRAWQWTLPGTNSLTPR